MKLKGKWRETLMPLNQAYPEKLFNETNLNVILSAAKNLNYTVKV